MPIPQLRRRSYGYEDETPKQYPPQKRRFKNPKKRNFSLKKTILFGLFILGVVGFLGGTILVAWASKDLPDPDRLTDREVAQSTKIFDRTGKELLYEIFADEKRTIVELDSIPKDLINGLIATEDKTFYEHKGIRPLSILRAYATGLLTSKRVSGASTITQQLVKNAILTGERSLTRKIKEAILSIRLEQKYSKDQILKIYFNEIPYGSTNYGVQSAAESYFDKDVKDLTLAESAALAGMPKAPSTYLNNTEAFKQRRNLVLRRMYEEGYITEEQKNTAQAEELVIKTKYNETLKKAPHFVLYVRELLVNKYGEALVEKGGLKVITTLDWGKQQIANEVISGEEGKKVLKAADANNASLVAIDPKSGQVLSMVGSRDFFDDSIGGQFNVATLGKLQPGSSFKPIIYAAAFEKGYTPDTILYDTLTNFAVSGAPRIIKNYDLKEHGPLTMRQALAGSLNIPAVKTFYLVGEKRGVDFAERLGYTTLKDQDCGLVLVLGCGAVKLLEHTNAFAAFANNGVQFPSVSILKVEDNTGKVLWEWKKEKGTEVIKPDIAATISNVLSDDAARAFIFGAGGVLTLPGRPLAAKTGTTSFYKDAWTVGYTPSLAVGMWAGNSSGTPMKSGSTGSMLAARLWNQFMKQALKDTPVEKFPPLPPNTAEKPVLKGSSGGSITLKVNKITGKRVSSSTPEALIEERTYIQPHEILHYVDKDNPRGPVPEHPENDPQYSGWEKGLQEWIGRRVETDPTWNPNFEEPPTEYDDAYSLELIPSLQVFSPQKGSTLTSRQITTSISVSAPRGVSRVSYKLDGTYIGVERQHPFNLSYNAENLDAGEHVLTIIVEDDIGNRIEEIIPFRLEVESRPPGVSFSERSYSLTHDSFPFALSLFPRKIENLTSVRIYVRPINGGTKEQIAVISDFNTSILNNQLTTQWSQAPLSGNYVLGAEVTDKNGNTSVSDEIPVEIKQ